MPVDAPEITRRECVVAGAELYLVDGLINRRRRAGQGRPSRQRTGYQEVSTLKEPYRIEGKKTMGYEIAEQLGWRVPDVILYPAGGGVGLIGIHKALLELRELGWIGGDAAAAGRRAGRPAARRSSTPSRPASTRARLVEGTHTRRVRHQRAQGARRLPGAPGGARVRRHGGRGHRRGDPRRARHLAAAEGAWVCPEGAACLAAARELRESGWIGEHEQVVVLNTGTGLKYPDT